MLCPTDTFTVYPDGEGDSKPSFEFRAQSAAYWIDYERRLKELQRDRPDDYIAKLVAMAGEGLAGWTNIEATFNPSSFSDVVGLSDALVIAMAKPYSAMLSDSDKKKSKSQPQSQPDSSAVNAVVEGA
jgi:hypothetical protein